MSIPQTPSPLSNIIAAKTYNAAWFSGSTKELQITAAIAAAVLDGGLYVYVPANMLPYNPANVTFNASVKMLREGGHSTAFDIKAYGAAGDNIQDDTLSILAADAGAGYNAGVNPGSDVFFPPNSTYKTTQNLLVFRRWFGVPWGSTRIMPTAAVTKCLDIRTGTTGSGTIEGLYLDGINTNGSTGIDIGSTTAVNITTVRDTMVWRFGGIGGRGIEIKQLVTGIFDSVYCGSNYIGLHTNGGNTPTDTIFINCQFRLSTTKGVWLETAYALRFIKPLFEANGEEGLYIQNVGGNCVEITIDDAWFEGNWQSQTYGVNRHAKYHCFADGANGPAGTIRIAFLCAKFNEDINEARAYHLTNVTGFSDFASKVTNSPGQWLVDGTSYGNFDSWNGNNGSFLTTVTVGANAAAWSDRSHLEDNIEAAFSSYVPVVTASGAMTVAALVITKARYKIIGKRLLIKLQLSFTLGGVAGTQIFVTLPTNSRSFDANEYLLAWLTDGAANVVGYARPDGTNPTSTLDVGKLDGTNWTLGAGRSFVFGGEFELF